MKKTVTYSAVESEEYIFEKWELYSVLTQYLKLDHKKIAEGWIDIEGPDYEAETSGRVTLTVKYKVKTKPDEKAEIKIDEQNV